MMKRSSTLCILPLLIAVLWPASTVCAAQIGSRAHPFPDTMSSVKVFTDQLPGSPTNGQWRFIASHYAGTQKDLTVWTQHIRTLNPSFIVVHYQLSVGGGPVPASGAQPGTLSTTLVRSVTIPARSARAAVLTGPVAIQMQS